MLSRHLLLNFRGLKIGECANFEGAGVKFDLVTLGSTPHVYFKLFGSLFCYEAPAPPPAPVAVAAAAAVPSDASVMSTSPARPAPTPLTDVVEAAEAAETPEALFVTAVAADFEAPTKNGCDNAAFAVIRLEGS